MDWVKTFAEVLGFLLGIGLLDLILKGLEFLKNKVSESEDSKLKEAVETLVEAAEKTLKTGDLDGQKRNEFVKSGLVKLGYDITEFVDSLIEAAVFKLPK